MNTEPVVVYISGCWDLFHVGHLNIIRAAAALGRLVVGVMTDEGMRTYGKEPIIPFRQRMAIVAALECVDAVVASHGTADISSVVEWGASVRVMGPDQGTYEGVLEARATLESMGVVYVEVPRTPGVSSTLIRQACHQAIGIGDLR